MAKKELKQGDLKEVAGGSPTHAFNRYNVGDRFHVYLGDGWYNWEIVFAHTMTMTVSYDIKSTKDEDPTKISMTTLDEDALERIIEVSNSMR